MANGKKKLLKLKDSTLVLKNKEEQEYHYKKYQGFSSKIMAKRTSNESSISDVLQQFIQVNRLEAVWIKLM